LLSVTRAKGTSASELGVWNWLATEDRLQL